MLNWSRVRFYLGYALNNLRTNGRQTVFGVLCIAAGVAAIVSLLTLGQMIKDSFSGNLRQTNLADIRVLPSPPADAAPDIIQQARDDGLISPQGYFRLDAVRQIQTWIDENYPGEVELTYRQALETNSGLVVTNLRTGELNPLTIPFIVETQKFPLYGRVPTESRLPLSFLIQSPTDIVVSRKLADQLDIRVGDTLRLNDARDDFKVRGVVSDDVIGSLDYFKVAAGALGYYYLDTGAVDLFSQMPHRADIVFLRLEDSYRMREISRALQEAFPYFSTITTDDLRDQNSFISNTIIQLVSVMGLVSMLIGGIGIVNTMLVVVRRRLEEIAVLKTLGLEPNEVTLLFLAEAVIIGVVGSLIGILIGWGVAYLIQGLAEAFLAQTLAFEITPGPAITGFVVGVLVTAVFGFLPTLTAGQIRPWFVLHPRDEIVPVAARLRLFAALMVMLVILSVVAQGMIGDVSEVVNGFFNLTAGIVGAVLGLLIGGAMAARNWLLNGSPRHKGIMRQVPWFFWLVGLPGAGYLFGRLFPALLILAAAFVTVGILYVLLWLLLWVIGHLAFPWMLFDLKLALRSLLATRSRNASTLLALVVGVFTLSLMTMLVDAVRQRFVELIVQETGGNVIVYVTGSNESLRQVRSVLSVEYGSDSYAIVRNYRTRLVAVDDIETGETLTLRDLEQRVAEKFKDSSAGIEQLRSSLEFIDARHVSANLPDFPFYSGRQLNAEDADRPVIVIAANDATLAAGLSVGDRLTFRISNGETVEGSNELTVEIVGMTDRRNSIVSGLSAANYVPLSLFSPTAGANQIRVIMDIEESQLPVLRQQLSAIDGTFVLETKSLNDLLNRLIDQFTAFPILVAGLALFTGGVVIANSVALSTMERRRDIATMKAIGLARWRVLGMLLIEYGVMGLAGGLIGVGISASILGGVLAFFFQGEARHAVPYLTVLMLMLLCVMIALVAALLSAWGASSEKPLNVLRYK